MKIYYVAFLLINILLVMPSCMYVVLVVGQNSGGRRNEILLCRVFRNVILLVMSSFTPGDGNQFLFSFYYFPAIKWFYCCTIWTTILACSGDTGSITNFGSAINRSISFHVIPAKGTLSLLAQGVPVCPA